MGHTLLSCILYSFLLKSGYFEYVCDDAYLLSLVWLFAALWISAHQALLSMGFFRQEYWSGLPFPPPRDLPDQRIEPKCPVCPALAGRFFTCWAIGEAAYHYQWIWVAHEVNPWMLQCAVEISYLSIKALFPPAFGSVVCWEGATECLPGTQFREGCCLT